MSKQPAAKDFMGNPLSDSPTMTNWEALCRLRNQQRVRLKEIAREGLNGWFVLLCLTCGRKERQKVEERISALGKEVEGL